MFRCSGTFKRYFKLIKLTSPTGGLISFNFLSYYECIFLSSAFLRELFCQPFLISQAVPPFFTRCLSQVGFSFFVANDCFDEVEFEVFKHENKVKSVCPALIDFKIVTSMSALVPVFVKSNYVNFDFRRSDQSQIVVDLLLLIIPTDTIASVNM